MVSRGIRPGATSGLIDKLVSKNISIEAGDGGNHWDVRKRGEVLTGTIAKNDDSKIVHFWLGRYGVSQSLVCPIGI